jgi:formimidoylglutamate deiminase
MTTIWAKSALLTTGWAQNVQIQINDGRIARITENAPQSGHCVPTVLAAPANAHSHAFQRAMAGLTEKRGPDPSDSFWTWRKLMFNFLDQITPDQVEAIAAFVQMEMLEAGYATNVEFHYLHHRANGQAYDDIGEMSARIAAAAAQTGIGLTLLPVQYQYGGCDQRPLGPGQTRFGTDLDQFAKLHARASEILRDLPKDTVLGAAPHSLRAVGQPALQQMQTLAGNGPIHMHLAEQIAEVDEVQSAWGARPVEWALDHLNLGPQWCLIHCTQMQPAETRALARSGAVAGLCPLTEASLGDGIFDGARWLKHNGQIAIGSDSNIRISLAEELRQLETTQRLRDHSRAALATPDHSTGRRLFDAAVIGGAQAAGRGRGALAEGAWADLLGLDDDHPDLDGLQGDTMLDSFAMTGDNRMIRDVWAAGRHMVQNGAHIHRARLTQAYKSAIRSLRSNL